MNRPPLIIGAGGRLGAVLYSRLSARGEVHALSRTQLDLLCLSGISAVLEPLEFSHIIITAALTGVDYCETHEDEAFAINATAPGIIAQLAAKRGAHVTYISTDMVFDGLKDEPYEEVDEALPQSVYGASKLEGERLVLAASPRNLVTRISWVFGPGRAAFPEWVIAQALSKTDVRLPGNKIACPTYTLDLLDWIEALIFNNKEGPAGGVFHLCNSDPCTWRDWGQHCIDTAREAGLPILAREITGVPVDSVSAFVAKRPVNSALDTQKFKQVTGLCPRSWRDSVYDHVMQNVVPHEQTA